MARTKKRITLGSGVVVEASDVEKILRDTHGIAILRDTNGDIFKLPQRRERNKNPFDEL